MPSLAEVMCEAVNIGSDRCGNRRITGSSDEVDSCVANDADKGRQASDKVMVLEVKEIIDAPTSKVQTVWVSVHNGQAIAVGEEITATNRIGGNIGCLVFTLVRSQEVWLVDDIDFNTEVEANEQVEEFKKANLDAESLPVAVVDDTCGNLIQLAQKH